MVMAMHHCFDMANVLLPRAWTGPDPATLAQATDHVQEVFLLTDQANKPKAFHQSCHSLATLTKLQVLLKEM